MRGKRPKIDRKFLKKYSYAEDFLKENPSLTVDEANVLIDKRIKNQIKQISALISKK